MVAAINSVGLLRGLSWVSSILAVVAVAVGLLALRTVVKDRRTRLESGSHRRRSRRGYSSELLTDLDEQRRRRPSEESANQSSRSADVTGHPDYEEGAQAEVTPVSVAAPKPTPQAPHGPGGADVHKATPLRQAAVPDADSDEEERARLDKANRDEEERR
jgi:hypothetical protein